VEIRDTRYAKTSDGVYVAYQTAGEGPLDVVWQFDAFGNVDLIWDEPWLGAVVRGLASFCRVILHDRRGTGLSSRNVPPPNLETRVSDLRLVLDTVGSDRPALVGINEGGAANVLFAATNPDRVRSMVWIKPLPRVVWAPDFPWGVKPEYVQHEERAFELWGTNEYGLVWAEAEASEGETLPPEVVRLGGVMSRHTATPDVARELARIWYETDVRGVLPSVQAPTLLIGHESAPVDVETLDYVASLMTDASIVVLPGSGFQLDDVGLIVEEIRKFLGAESPAPDLDTILATVLFTDIVDSTKKQASLGDRGWKDLIEHHHAIVREALGRWRGVEADTAGDGFFATFDGPARAIHCAVQITEHVRDLGIEIRAGVHTGESEVIDGKVGGIAVTTGSRISSQAGPSEVLVSQTVRDLVAGSGLTFEDAGEHELKGVPDRWHLYRVTSQHL
jgi:class 3 adenylate cyclase/pimeloyl-ACP methyl ester carboxylesterase